MRERSRREGSILVVLGVAVVLGTLGAAAATLSTGLGRKELHQALRENALEVARSAADEAALMIHNGKVSIDLDDSALERLAPVRIPSTLVTGARVERMGIPAHAAPTVLVRASRIGAQAHRKKPPSEQLTETLEEIATKGYSKEEYLRQKTFWDEVRAENMAGREEYEKDQLDSRFWEWTHQVGLDRWNHQSKSGDWKTPMGSAGGKPQGLPGVAQLFYEPGEDGVPAQRLTARPRDLGQPFLDELGERWDRAMREVGRDAAQRMASCGANPALAMAHLVGDLRTGALISSDTEVQYTSSYMHSKELGADMTYLLEIGAQMRFGSEGTRMDGSAYFTTYRLFQKVEWEAILDNMTAALLQSLRDHDVTEAEIQKLFPPVKDHPLRDAPLFGNTSRRFDPYKVLRDPIFAELPSTAGARMYPYAVAQTYGRGIFDSAPAGEARVFADAAPPPEVLARQPSPEEAAGPRAGSFNAAQ